MTFVFDNNNAANLEVLGDISLLTKGFKGTNRLFDEWKHIVTTNNFEGRPSIVPLAKLSYEHLIIEGCLWVIITLWFVFTHSFAYGVMYFLMYAAWHTLVFPSLKELDSLSFTLCCYNFGIIYGVLFLFGIKILPQRVADFCSLLLVIGYSSFNWFGLHKCMHT